MGTPNKSIKTDPPDTPTTPKIVQAVPWLVIVCSILLAAGLNAPAMKMLPTENADAAAIEELGSQVDRILDAVGVQPEGQSIYTHIKNISDRPPIVLTTLSAIRELFDSENYVVGVGILCGSMLFPFIRLALFLVLFDRLQKGQPVRRWIGLTESVAKWCLLDVMILAFVAASFSTLPLHYSVRLQWGVYLTAGAVILSILIPWLLTSQARTKHNKPEQIENVECGSPNA
ncbi:MAG: hypothetical protein HN350_09470 [Phycisphaerales bacterium]|jgi:hypothetical protein|nr:hypothetical protein [Phycisphaerales bacterium]